MALIIETGTGLDPTANSYATRAELIAYAADRGVTLIDDVTTDVLGIKAMDFLSIQKWKGHQTQPDVQPLDWPRTDVRANWLCLPVGIDVIPLAVKKAQCQLALDASTGIELVPSKGGSTSTTGSSPFVTVDKIGPLETHYSEAIALAAAAGGVSPILTLALDMLLPYLQGGAGPTRAYRV